MINHSAGNSQIRIGGKWSEWKPNRCAWNFFRKSKTSEAPAYHISSSSFPLLFFKSMFAFSVDAIVAFMHHAGPDQLNATGNLIFLSHPIFISWTPKTNQNQTVFLKNSNTINCSLLWLQPLSWLLAISLQIMKLRTTASFLHPKGLHHPKLMTFLDVSWLLIQIQDSVLQMYMTLNNLRSRYLEAYLGCYWPSWLLISSVALFLHILKAKIWNTVWILLNI